MTTKTLHRHQGLRQSLLEDRFTLPDTSVQISTSTIAKYTLAGLYNDAHRHHTLGSTSTPEQSGRVFKSRLSNI